MKYDVLLTSEDLQFLKELGHELKTQDNLATAKPLVFKIRYSKKTPGIDPDLSDDLCILNNEGDVFYEIDEVKEYIQSNYFEDEKSTWDCFLDSIGLRELDLDYIFDICKILENLAPNKSWRVSGFEENYVYKGEFLTYKSAKTHLSCNAHHYGSDAIIYIDHSWRNPVFEKLLEIVEKFDV